MQIPFKSKPKASNNKIKCRHIMFLLFVLMLSATVYIYHSLLTLQTITAETNYDYGSRSFTLIRSLPHPSSSVDNNPQRNAADWKPFNNTNPHQHTWCPTAICQNSPLCTPCARRHLFLVCTARSGSTTLLRMFNALPNVRLSGENHNQIQFVAKLTYNLVNHHPRLLQHPMDKPDGPFMHNTIPKGSFGCIAQDVFHMMNPPPLAVQQNKAIQMADYDKDLILGFKTVRMHTGDWTAQEASEYLKSHFPCSRVIINYQTNITHQIESYHQAFGNGKNTYSGPSMDELIKANQFQLDLYQSLGDDYSKLIDMDEWSKDVQVLNDIVTWLGFDKCQFDAIVHENLKGYTRDTSTKLKVGKNCRPPPS